MGWVESCKVVFQADTTYSLFFRHFCHRMHCLTTVHSVTDRQTDSMLPIANHAKSINMFINWK